MKIIPISIPTPFYVGDVNVYLIKEDPITLIDVGPKTKEATEALRRGLESQGIQFADIRRIVLTHAHEDHCGLAKKVRDESKNAEIFIHPWETGHLFGRLAHEEHKNLMDRAGVPGSVFGQLKNTYEEISLLTDSLSGTDYNELIDEMRLDFETGSLDVIHTPGHTPGSCSFLRRADRTLICGDCVLKRITPNPIITPDPVDGSRRFKSLSEYLVSLARLRKEAPTKVYGGHGEPIHDFEEIFNRYIRAIDKRQKDVIRLVEHNGSTGWEIAEKLFPNAIGEEVHGFLAISESVAHLDYARDNGKLIIELNDGVEYYRRRN